MASHPSRRGSNFCRFLVSDVEKITIFWESTLCEIIAFFRTRQSLCKTKFPKKILFWGIFPDIFFIMFPFPGYVFTLCFLGAPRRLVGRPKKWRFYFFGVKKMTFFRVRQYGAFWRKRSHCGDGYHISPPTGLNLESAEISTSKFANPKQQMSKSIQQFLKCTLISSPLIRWKWPTQVGTLGTLWWVESLEWCNPQLPQECPKKSRKKNVFSGVWKNADFSGHGSRMTVRKNSGYLVGWLSGWLAGYLAGYLAGWLCGWLPGWLAIWQLALWLPGWLFGY